MRGRVRRAHTALSSSLSLFLSIVFLSFFSFCFSIWRAYADDRALRKRDQKQKVLNEIGILKKISNPQIVKFVEAFESFNEIIIITEYLNGGELFDR